MLIRVNRRTGQAIVIMALALVAICGMLALAIDAGRLYFQRRLMQDAGAQDLVGTAANPNGVPNQALYHAQQDTFAVFNGEFIGFTMNLDSGTLPGNAAGATPTCPGPVWNNRGIPALLVQYNKAFAPAPGTNSFLVK